MFYIPKRPKQESSAKSQRTWNDLTSLRELLKCCYISAEKKDQIRVALWMKGRDFFF